MEPQKFAEPSAAYHDAIDQIVTMGFDARDYIHHNPAFNGTVNLARMFSLYELYKRTLGLSGHIAEVGVWKGASLLLLAKLTEIFEPSAYTLVHGFDWFAGMDPGEGEQAITPGSYKGDYETLSKLIALQKLDHVVRLHKLDVTQELERHFEQNSSQMFKLVFLDAGTYAVVKSCLPIFWPRLHSGGVLILDQYNDQRASGETRALREFLPDARIQTCPWSRQPSAFIVKP